MSDIVSEFVNVDLRGLKSALVAHARERRLSLSRVVRDSVEVAINREDPDRVPVRAMGKTMTRVVESGLVRVWLRLTPEEFAKLAATGDSSGLSHSAVVGEMLIGTRNLRSSVDRKEQRSALVASNAELAVLSRNLRNLADLLGRSHFEAAQQYRGLLDTVANDVKRHLKVAGVLLADVPTNRSRGGAIAPPRRRSDR